VLLKLIQELAAAQPLTAAQIHLVVEQLPMKKFRRK